MNKNNHKLGSVKYLEIALGITLSFFIIELVGGVLTNSLALLADAWHMLNDAAALIFALMAAWVSTRPTHVKKLLDITELKFLRLF
jgi:cobalt-zinc-cadmium efflux system protein